MTTGAFQRGDEVEIAERLLWTIDDNSKNLIADEGNLYHYEHGVWLKAPVAQLMCLMADFAGAFVTETPTKRLKVQAGTIQGALKIAVARVEEEGFFSDAPTGMSFKNGFLAVDASGARLVPHARDQKQRVQYPWAWREDMSSPTFEAFVRAPFKGDADVEEKVAFLQELFGASLIGAATKLQKCAVLIGDGSNGKDTLLDVLQGAFPEESISAIGPHTWGNEYYRAALVEKKLNVIGELPKKELDESEAFKAVIAGSKLGARVTYGRLFFFRPKAGHIFAANNVMGSNDFSHGFYRRFGIVSFNRTFTDADKDINIAARIGAEREAIVAWLVAGAVRVLARGGYILPASHTEQMTAWKLSSDNVAAFSEELTPVGETRAMALYESYRFWCERNGHKSCSSTKFFTRLKSHMKDRGWGAPRRDDKGFLYPVQYGRVMLTVDTAKNPNDSSPLS